MPTRSSALCFEERSFAGSRHSSRIDRNAWLELGRCQDVELLVSTTGKKHENGAPPHFRIRRTTQYSIGDRHGGPADRRAPCLLSTQIRAAEPFSRGNTTGSIFVGAG